MSISAISSTSATNPYSYFRVNQTAQTYARNAERQATANQQIENSKRQDKSEDEDRKDSTVTAKAAAANESRTTANAVSYNKSGTTTRTGWTATGQAVDLVA